MYYITKEQYAHDIGVLNCHIVDLSTKIAELEAILNQLRVPPEKPKECTEYAPLKENETLRGEKGKDVTSEVRAAFEEDVTKEVRAAFEVVKTLSEDYLMSPPKEYPQTQMPLSELIGKGIDFKGITHISINGGRVLSAAILSIDNDKVILSIKGNIHSWNISEITVIK